MLVSAGSYAVYPRSYIWFGVLHAIALSLVLIRPLAGRPVVALAPGLAVVAAGNLIASPWLDGRAWGWLGFLTIKPVTEDYVPPFPRTGVMPAGVALGHTLARIDFRTIARFARLPRWIAWLGWHGLVVQMVHQPVLVGGLWLVPRH